MVNDPDRPDKPDATSKLPPIEPAEDTTVVSGPTIDPTAETVVGGPPAPDAETVVGPAEPRWSARANVPAPGSAPMRPSAPPQWQQEWPEEDPYEGRSWLTPVIVGIVVLLLVAVLGVGIWLIYRSVANGQRSGGEPQPSLASSEAPSSPPSSAAPSPTESPSPSAVPSIVEVTIPALRGDTAAEAMVKLRALGLEVRITEREDASLPVGQVLDSTPTAGSTVAVGETVTLIVAKAPAPAPPSPSAKSPSPTASGGGG